MYKLACYSDKSFPAYYSTLFTLLLLCGRKEESVMPLSPLFGEFFVKWILLETTVSNQNYEVVFFLVLTVCYLTRRKSELKIKV